VANIKFADAKEFKLFGGGEGKRENVLSELQAIHVSITLCGTLPKGEKGKIKTDSESSEKKKRRRKGRREPPTSLF